MASNDISLMVRTYDAGLSTCEINGDLYLDVRVREDDQVQVYNDAAERYWNAPLDPATHAEALRLADQVRAGTHYTEAGFVFEKALAG